MAEGSLSDFCCHSNHWEQLEHSVQGLPKLLRCLRHLQEKLVHVGPFPVIRRESLNMFGKKTSFEALVCSRIKIASSVSTLIYP
jgi:hypothetical protein